MQWAITWGSSLRIWFPGGLCEWFFLLFPILMDAGEIAVDNFVSDGVEEA
jgi:hypothetical protein